MSDDDLTFPLARSIAMGPAVVDAGASITRRNRAAKQLANAHAAVLNAKRADRPAALERFHALAVIALGLGCK